MIRQYIVHGLLLESLLFDIASFTASIATYQSRSHLLVGQLATFWNNMEPFGGQSVEQLAYKLMPGWSNWVGKKIIPTVVIF